MERCFIDVLGARLHVVAAGPVNGPLVVLLHGFPDFWFVWRRQLPALAAAGLRVVAPDLRGYNLSSKPRGVRAYRAATVAGDIAALIGALGAERASVVGHDWGGGIAWQLAGDRPDLVERLAIINAPHPARFLRAARSPRQLWRSWYMLFFQLPWLPEALMRAGDFALPRRQLRRDTAPGAFTGADERRYRAAWGQPGALTGEVNYYRAAARQGPGGMRRAPRRIAAPTLVIWGERDPFLLPELAAPDPAWVPDVHVERLPDAGHWAQLDAPTRVNDLLIAFFTSSRAGARYRGRPG